MTATGTSNIERVVAALEEQELLDPTVMETGDWKPGPVRRGQIENRDKVCGKLGGARCVAPAKRWRANCGRSEGTVFHRDLSVPLGETLTYD